MKEKINTLLKEISKDIYEKDEAIKLSLLSALSGESIFLLGAPGVAKSLISRRLKYIFEDATSFEYLMNRFSTPEEIFGPVAISKLEHDKYERVTENYLPTCDVVFLDEIWKAGPSIQNSLLTVLNEKVYKNGTQEEKIKLKALISASNELPAKGEGLDALWDRFIIRYIVDNIQDDENFFDMLTSNISLDINIESSLKISEIEYIKIQKEAKNIQMPIEVLNTINIIRKKISQYNETHKDKENFIPLYISDRRWKKIWNILQTSAYLNCRDKVDLMDCFLIVHMIWNEEEDIEIVKNIILETIQEHGYSLQFDLTKYRDMIDELQQDIKTFTSYIRKIPTKKKKTKRYNEDEYYQLTDKSNYIYYVLKSDIDNTKINEWTDNIQIYSLNNQNSLEEEHYDSFYRQNELLLIDNERYPNKTYTLEEIDYETIEVESIAPNQPTLNDWNTRVKNILAEIEKDKKTIASYKDIELKTLKENIFVDIKLSKYVEKNLFELIGRLMRYENEVEKLKDSYENLN